jgi:hypothetical protein
MMMIALSLAGCGGDEEAPPDVDALYTAAAQTLGAQFTQQALEQPSATPTPTFSLPSPTATQTLPTPSPTNTQSSSGSSGAGIFSDCDVAEFVADITIPDGTEMAPGTDFTKTWEVKNVGTCAWDSSYKLIFYFGQQMAEESSYQLTTETVEVGETLQISVPMKAPGQAGEYYSHWRMQNAQGELFGLLANAEPVYAQVKVVSGGATSTATSQNTATATTAITPTNTTEPTPTETTPPP